NEKVWRFLKMGLWIGALLVSIAIAYGALNNQVQGNTTTIEKHDEKLEQHDKDVVELKTDVKHIRKTVDWIKEKM
ncbi:unnamed protein product, partial [marine sediment metagenome]